MTPSARRPTGPGKKRKEQSGKADEKQAALARAARDGGAELDGFDVIDSGDDDPVLATMEARLLTTSRSQAEPTPEPA
ncbi:hypothetical protein [Streptomyces sp. NPDC048496]|uniref:hypothetical protein n=1 Tax=Streptomyces sp. NPDC048496 TaxID=3365558 RepID=UPI003715A97B